MDDLLTNGGVAKVIALYMCCGNDRVEDAARSSLGSVQILADTIESCKLAPNRSAMQPDESLPVEPPGQTREVGCGAERVHGRCVEERSRRSRALKAWKAKGPVRALSKPALSFVGGSTPGPSRTPCAYDGKPCTHRLGPRGRARRSSPRRRARRSAADGRSPEPGDGPLARIIHPRSA
jgi:hypothetical protein